MPNVISRNDPQYLDKVIALAGGPNLKSGILNEPRIYFDVISQSGSTTEIIGGSPGVFINGEQFPVRITHLLAAQAYLDQDDKVASELLIQQVGARLLFHDQFYMNAQFVPMPLWGNKVVAAPEPISLGNAHWDLVQNGAPVVLSARDTMIVTVMLNDASAPSLGGVPVNFCATGFGMLSRRPYFMDSQVVLDDLSRTDFSTVDFRNDGLEPIIITDLTMTVSAEVQDTTPVGVIGRVSLNIRQVGNGTGANWFSGPQTPVAIPLMPATMLGLTSGRAVVHQFPGDGLVWNPGDGMTVETQSRVQDGEAILVLAMAGYLMVT